MKITRENGRWCVLSFGRVDHECMERLALRHGYRVMPVCAELGVSEGYFRQVFERDVGLSPKEWMRWERMVVARRLLVSGLCSREVSDTLGFSKPETFKREFLTMHGMKPKRFLELRRQDDA